jgi:hypothetical protein
MPRLKLENGKGDYCLVQLGDTLRLTWNTAAELKIGAKRVR